jgi:hypothetical protein
MRLIACAGWRLARFALVAALFAVLCASIGCVRAGFDPIPDPQGDAGSLDTGRADAGGLDASGVDASDAGSSDALPIAPKTPFGKPQPVTELNSAWTEDDPTISADGLEIFFTSRRPNQAKEDIWTATRADRTAPWGNLGPPPAAESLDAEDARAPHEHNRDGLAL